MRFNPHNTTFPIRRFNHHNTYSGDYQPTYQGGDLEGKDLQVMVDYIIMDVPSTYNIIIERSLINSPRATLSTYNLEM